MILIQGELTLPAGAVDANREAMRTMLEATRAEEGCILYAFAQDVLEPDLIRISECWTDQDALNAHAASAHMSAFNKAMGAAKPLGLDVRAYDSVGPRSLRG